jgi:hypothetical protein
VGICLCLFRLKIFVPLTLGQSELESD